jgi:outer membrane protein OmpA-like peptidoglycan-associated protein
MNGKILFFFLAFLLVKNSFSQNLVPNPSFEEFDQCPGSYNYSTDGKIAPGWTSPSRGTPDMFHSCSKGTAGVPTNWAGYSKANSGQGYAGIYVFKAKSAHSYREYLQATLKSALLKDADYLVEFYFKLSSNSKYSIDRIGVLLSDSSFTTTRDDVLHPPTHEFIMDKPYDKRTTGLWTKFSYRYKAKGGEKLITIGNFSTNEQTKNFFIHFSKAKEPMLNDHAYFFIDDVRVQPLQVPAQPVTPAAPAYKLYEYYVLKNVQFDFDRYHLVEASFAELQKVTEALKKHPDWNIIVRGHTDFVGSDQFNMELSLKRANSVKQYLADHGVATHRITAEGYGKKQPLKEGTTEEARAANRRVEILFFTK